MTYTAQISSDIAVYEEIYLGKGQSQDMHEILSSYEYSLQEKYIAPYFT